MRNETRIRRKEDPSSEKVTFSWRGTCLDDARSTHPRSMFDMETDASAASLVNEHVVGRVDLLISS